MSVRTRSLDLQSLTGGNQAFVTTTKGVLCISVANGAKASTHDGRPVISDTEIFAFNGNQPGKFERYDRPDWANREILPGKDWEYKGNNAGKVVSIVVFTAKENYPAPTASYSLPSSGSYLTPRSIGSSILLRAPGYIPL